MKRTFLILALVGGCSGTAPNVRYYELQLELPAAQRPDAVAERPVLAVEPFEVDTAYDDNRIVYRESPVRLDYYFYHRWSASPGTMVADELRSAYAKSGGFAAVEEGVTRETTVVLSGRVLAIEEVDLSKQRWKGRLRLSLQLRDVKTGELLWSKRLEEEEPMRAPTQEALALALSAALGRVVKATTSDLIRLAEERRATAAPPEN